MAEDDNLDFDPDEYDKPIVPPSRTFGGNSSRASSSSRSLQNSSISSQPNRRLAFAAGSKLPSSSCSSSTGTSRHTGSSSQSKSGQGSSSVPGSSSVMDSGLSHSQSSKSSSQIASSSESRPVSSDSISSRSRIVSRDAESTSTQPSQSQYSHDDTITTASLLSQSQSPHAKVQSLFSKPVDRIPTNRRNNNNLTGEESTSSKTSALSRPRDNESSGTANTKKSLSSTVRFVDKKNGVPDASQQESLSSLSNNVSATRSTSISTKMGATPAFFTSTSTNKTTKTKSDSRSTSCIGVKSTSKVSSRSSRPSQKKSGCLKEDDGDGDYSSTATTLSARGVAGIRTDVYAVADAGNTQFFRDEVVWCCSNIVGQSQKERLHASRDLALVVSESLSQSTSPFASAQTLLQDDVLKALLDLIAFCKTLIVNEEQQTDEEASESEQTAPEVRRFIAIVLHFIALACCREPSKRLTAKCQSQRNLRQAFLSSPDAMRGIMYLVLADPRLSQLRGRKRRLLSLVGSEQHSPLLLDEPTSPTSTSTASAASTPDSYGSQISTATAALNINDPTRAGRMKRSKKRPIETTSCARLSPIPEEKKSKTSHVKKDPTVDDCDDNLSFTGVAVDPIASKKVQIDEILSFSDKGDDGSGDISREPQPRFQKQIATLMRRVSKTKGVPLHVHSCGQERDVWLETLPLLALNRIITGKLEGSAHTIMGSTTDEVVGTTFSGGPRDPDCDMNLFEDEEGGSEGAYDADEKNENDEDQDDPVLATNRQLEESGIVSLLSSAVADTMVAVVRLLHRESRRRRRQKHVCQGCLLHLHDRVRMLVSIVDGASLFCSSNRVTFCQEGYAREFGGYLIVVLVNVLNSFLEVGLLFEGVWGDIILETLRTLTSLTHENKVAARELETSLQIGKGSCCLDILAQVLYASVAGGASGSDDKLNYDSSIFCLNIFTNYLESGGSQQKVADIQLTRDGSEASHGFLTWVTKWLVAETGSFREAVTESTFGSSPSKHSTRTLQDKEDEKLVVSGNGFVLLALMMISDGDAKGSSKEESRNKIRQLIGDELPGSNQPAKITFVKNVLKAFCNFYHVSVGDLSVAIVEPVKELIHQLEGTTAS